MQTEERQIKAVLQVNEERYQGLLNNLEAGIVVHATDTSIVMNNSKAAELLGINNRSMIGKEAFDSSWKFVDMDNNTLSIENFPVNKVLTSEKSIKNQVLGIHRPMFKDIVWVTVNGFPIFSETGDITEIVITFVDITARKLAEFELKGQTDILEGLVQVRTTELIERNKAKSYDNDFINKVRNCVLENISDNEFCINALATKLFMSRSTIQRKIERESGLTAAQFVREIRLEKAHYYIQSKTHRTLSETAFMVGFKHAGYFSRIYKKYCEEKVISPGNPLIFNEGQQ